MGCYASAPPRDRRWIVDETRAVLLAYLEAAGDPKHRNFQP